MSNSSFVYIHIYMYIYVHVSMYQMAPVDVAWSDLAKHCPWSKGQLIGMGSTVPLGTVPLVIPSPLKRGDGILLFPGFIYTIILLLLLVVVNQGSILA